MIQSVCIQWSVYLEFSKANSLIVFFFFFQTMKFNLPVKMSLIGQGPAGNVKQMASYPLGFLFSVN